jgi:hypothetical protein
VEQRDEPDPDEYHESHDDGDGRFKLQVLHDASHAQMRAERYVDQLGSRGTDGPRLQRALSARSA